MQINAASFSDPNLRPQLQQYYEHKKASAIEALRARDDSNLPKEITYKDAAGQAKTAMAMPISAEKMEKAFVSFDQWLDFQETSFDRHGPKSIEAAQERLAMLEKNNPDSPSNVEASFSHQGEILAYINHDGTVAMPNGSAQHLSPIIDKANDKTLQARNVWNI